MSKQKSWKKLIVVTGARPILPSEPTPRIEQSRRTGDLRRPNAPKQPRKSRYGRPGPIKSSPEEEEKKWRPEERRQPAPQPRFARPLRWGGFIGEGNGGRPPSKFSGTSKRFGAPPPQIMHPKSLSAPRREPSSRSKQLQQEHGQTEPSASASAPVNKRSKKNRPQKLQNRAKEPRRIFLKKVKQGKVVSVEELREGMKMKLKSTDSLIHCLTGSILSEQSRVTLGDVADVLSSAELASKIFIKIVRKLYEEVSATKMADILEESKVDFDEFVPEDETRDSFYGDMLEVTCFSAHVNREIDSSLVDSMSLEELTGLVSLFEAKDFSLAACRKIGRSIGRLLVDDETCLNGETEATSAMKKICGGNLKKTLFITSVVEKWYQKSAPKGLDGKFEKLVKIGVIDFENIRAWCDESGANAAKLAALGATSNWRFRMDEAQSRARQEDFLEENEKENEDLGRDSYAGNLFEKPKHKTYSDVITYYG